MNTAAKVLIIFVTVTSLTFMSLVGAVTMGGPNWWGRAQDLTDFKFDASPGEITTYSATYRATGESVGSSSAVLAQVVVDSLKKQNQVLTAREGELDQQISSEQANINALTTFQEADVAAIQARAEEFTQQLLAIEENIKQTNTNITSLLQQTTQEQEVMSERREDVLRLRDQLALLRTDQKRLEDQKTELEAILVLLQSSIEQMERRTQQLQQQQS